MGGTGGAVQVMAAQAGARVGPCQPDFCQDKQAVCWFQHSHQLSVQLGPAPVFQTLLTSAFLQGEGHTGPGRIIFPLKGKEKENIPWALTLAITSSGIPSGKHTPSSSSGHVAKKEMCKGKAGALIK